MKHLTACLFLLMSSIASADVFYCQGNVEFVRIMDPVMWGEDRSYIRLSNCPAAGSCLTEGGAVVLALRDNENANKQISLAMAAQATGSNVIVQVDDNHKNAVGSCYIGFITSMTN